MIKQNSNFDDFTQLEQYVSQEELAHIKTELMTCPEINNALCGTICELSKNHAKSIFISSPEMAIDDQGLIFEGFVFAAANYVAQAAINKEYSIIISARSSFYAPLKLGDVLILEAQALFDETSKKREIRVIGHVNDIKVYEASMQAVVTEQHIFKLKRPPSNVTQAPAAEEENPAPAVSPDAAALAMLNSASK
ncbi:hypothetical protein CQA38_04685 [Campylobacter sp. MIT 12-5580]|nr:hypothetical protein CQA38_04685 [Campylobacter sp. MIT 12-5580]